MRTPILQRAPIRIAALAFFALAQVATPATASTNWRIDPQRTHIAFAIDAVGYPRTHGEFRQFDGRISIDLDHPERSSVTFHVQSQSVDVGSQSFDDYLRSSAFLDADHHPSIDFVSKSVEKTGDHTVRVVGDLTLLGVTKPLTVNVAVTQEAGGKGRRFAFLAKTDIDRLEFGMNSGFPLVAKDVQLEISSGAVEL